MKMTYSFIYVICDSRQNADAGYLRESDSFSNFLHSSWLRSISFTARHLSSLQTSRTSRAANRHSLALRNRRYYPSNRSKTTNSLPRCRIKVRSRERQCSAMALAPFISSIKRHSSDDRPVCPRSALRPDFGLESARTIKVNQPFIRVACYTSPDNHFSLSFFLPSLVTQDSGRSLRIEIEISLRCAGHIRADRSRVRG